MPRKKKNEIENQEFENQEMHETETSANENSAQIESYTKTTPEGSTATYPYQPPSGTCWIDYQPRKEIRDQDGLLKNLAHAFSEDGRIDWRAMIPEKFIVINEDNFKKSGRAIPASIEGVDDRDLLILLGGFKELSRIRGIKNVNARVVTASQEYAAVEYKIEWIPNFETSFEQYSSVGMACAHQENTYDFSREYLLEMAENRAFCRAVKAGLGINILGKDEIGPNKNKSNQPEVADEDVEEAGPHKMLKNLMKSNAKLTLETIRHTMITNKYEGYESADEWNCVEDIPSDVAFSIVRLIKKKKSRS